MGGVLHRLELRAGGCRPVQGLVQRVRRRPVDRRPVASVLRDFPGRAHLGEAGAGSGRVRRLEAQQHRARRVQARLHLHRSQRRRGGPLQDGRAGAGRGHPRRHLGGRAHLGHARPAGEHPEAGHSQAGVLGCAHRPLRGVAEAHGRRRWHADVPLRGPCRQRASGDCAQRPAPRPVDRPHRGGRPHRAVARREHPHRAGRRRARSARLGHLPPRRAALPPRPKTPTSCSR